MSDELESKKAEMELKAKIKAAEDAKRAEAIKTLPKKREDMKMDFDAWYSMRNKSIPRIHYKEIIKADFKARGLKEVETLAIFDEALAKYGVKLA